MHDFMYILERLGSHAGSFRYKKWESLLCSYEYAFIHLLELNLFSSVGVNRA